MEIVAPLGAAGMGKIYRARDARFRMVAAMINPAARLYFCDGQLGSQGSEKKPKISLVSEIYRSMHLRTAPDCSCRIS